MKRTRCVRWLSLFSANPYIWQINVVTLAPPLSLSPEAAEDELQNAIYKLKLTGACPHEVYNIENSLDKLHLPSPRPQMEL